MAKPILSKMLEDKGYDKSVADSMADKLLTLGTDNKAILSIPLIFRRPDAGSIQSVYVEYLQKTEEEGGEAEEDSVLPPVRESVMPVEIEESDGENIHGN